MGIQHWARRCALSLALVGLPLGGACGDDSGGTNEGSNNNNEVTHTACGDGTEQGAEECDNGALNSDSEPDACRTNCLLPHCGDGVVDTGEPCDDGAANSDEVHDACRTDCALPSCGAGVV
ncbi:MAG: hypothetical protein ABI333_20355, partial [bacterium]